MKTKILVSIFVVTFCLSGCATTPYSKTDKALFGSVVALQVVDGLTTADMLSDGSVMSGDWAWKYGTDTPSASRMWGIKALELGGAYVAGRYLPPAWRRGFFLIVDSILLYCIQTNLQVGAGFTVNY